MKIVNRMVSALRSLPVFPRTRLQLHARKAIGGLLLPLPHDPQAGLIEQPIRKIEQKYGGQNTGRYNSSEIVSEDTAMDIKYGVQNPERYNSSEYTVIFRMDKNDRPVNSKITIGPWKNPALELSMAKAYYLAPLAKLNDILAVPLPLVALQDALFLPVDLAFFAASKTYQAIARLIK